MSDFLDNSIQWNNILESRGNVEVPTVMPQNPVTWETMFEQCPLRNSVTKPHWTGAKTSLVSAKIHSSGSCYRMAQVNLGQEKRASFLSVVSFCLNYPDNCFTFKVSFACMERQLYLFSFVVCYNRIITCNSQKSFL